MDWKQIISDMRENGLTQAQIAERAKVAQSFVSELSTGAAKDPRFSIGQRLISLHRSVTRKGAKRCAEA